jgi:hypothetical protein
VTQFDLFGDRPIEAGPVVAPEGIMGASTEDVKWTSWRGARRVCDHCTLLIHQLGTDKAPFPRTATSRRKGPVSDAYLCPEHAAIMREKDEAAEKVRLARIAENAPQTAAQRAAWAKRRRPREGLS